MLVAVKACVPILTAASVAVDTISNSNVRGASIEGIYLLFPHNNPLNGLKEALALPPRAIPAAASP